MLVMSTSLRYRAPTALIPALGVSAANLVWISLAAGGLAAFAAKFPLVLIVLKVAGICLIAWLAFTLAFADPSRHRSRARPIRRCRRKPRAPGCRPGRFV